MCSELSAMQTQQIFKHKGAGELAQQRAGTAAGEQGHSGSHRATPTTCAQPLTWVFSWAVLVGAARGDGGSEKPCAVCTAPNVVAVPLVTV